MSETDQMKKSSGPERILRAMTDVDDQYIQDAIQFAGDPEKARRAKVIRFRRTSRVLVAVAACLALLMIGNRLSGGFLRMGRSVSSGSGSEPAYESAAQAEPYSAESAEESSGTDSGGTVASTASSADEMLTAVPSSDASGTSADANQEAVTASNGTESIASSADSSRQGASEETADSLDDSANAAAGNPYQEVASLSEAESITGFGMKVPEAAAPYNKMMINVIDDTMIEVSYETEDGSDIGYSIRKAEGSDDISGDYNDYQDVHTERIGDADVTVKGDGSAISMATWTAGGYSYAVDAQDHPMSLDSLTQIIEAME